MAGGPGKPKSANPQVLFDKALAAYQAGDEAKAQRLAKKLTKAAPHVADAWQLKAIISLNAGKADAAVKDLRRGLRADPASLALHDLLGSALTESGEHAAAVESFERALERAPKDPGILNNLGNALRHLGQFDEARERYRESLAQRPDHPDTVFNLANVLIHLEDFEAAETALRAAQKIAPNDPEILRNLGVVLMKARRRDEAEHCFQRIVDLGFADHSVYNNLAMSHLTLGRFEQARALITKALEMAPDDSQVLVNASIIYFLEGSWLEAWTAYEARWRRDLSSPRPHRQPLWQGQPLGGETILVWGEQGLGDEIMFASMIPDLIAADVRVILECDSRLVSLFKRAFAGITCVAREDPPLIDTTSENVTYQVPSGNLGRWFRAGDADFADGRPFLVADEVRTHAMRRKYLSGDEHLLIGITWCSYNRDTGDVKSMDLEVLLPLLEMPGLKFFDLQYGDTKAERGSLEARTGITLGRDEGIDPVVDFDGHTAQVAAMDLVISISNTTVHAAGALGVPVWVMLPTSNDRRWMMDREDSPWYGSVKLFRQTKDGDWPGVVQRVKKDLLGFIESANADA